MIECYRTLVRSQPNWNWIDFEGPHDSVIADPDAIVKLLLIVELRLMCDRRSGG